MWKLLRSVTLRSMTVALKIMPAYKLNVRGSGRVGCLLQRPPPKKTRGNLCKFAHMLTHKHHQSPRYISLSAGS